MLSFADSLCLRAWSLISTTPVLYMKVHNKSKFKLHKVKKCRQIFMSKTVEFGIYGQFILSFTLQKYLQTSINILDLLCKEELVRCQKAYSWETKILVLSIFTRPLADKVKQGVCSRKREGCVYQRPPIFQKLWEKFAFGFLSHTTVCIEPLPSSHHQPLSVSLSLLLLLQNFLFPKSSTLSLSR